MSRANWIWFILYVVAMLVVASALSRARQRAIGQLATRQARTDWEDWQTEAVRQSAGDGPVHRRISRSEEPPELVLLRDHFFTCLGGLWLFTTALFLTLLFMIRGVSSGRRFEVHVDRLST